MARYFIGQPSEDGEWEVGDRQLDNDQVAQCDSEDKAMRVARALSALDGKDDAAGRQHEIDMLREALAQSRHELADVESRNAELEEQLAAVAMGADVIYRAAKGTLAAGEPAQIFRDISMWKNLMATVYGRDPIGAPLPEKRRRKKKEPQA